MDRQIRCHNPVDENARKIHATYQPARSPQKLNNKQEYQSTGNVVSYIVMSALCLMSQELQTHCVCVECFFISSSIGHNNQNWRMQLPRLHTRTNHNIIMECFHIEID